MRRTETTPRREKRTFALRLRAVHTRGRGAGRGKRTPGLLLGPALARGRGKRTLGLLLGLALALGAARAAQAQPPGGMPDLRTMMGKPLPTPELPAGTVVVRVSKQLPMNGVAGVEVTATVTGAGGDARIRKAKTGGDGRAPFEGIAPGSTFKAQVSVEGESLETSAFEVPAQGGIRTLLIAGLGAAGAEAPANEAAGGDEQGQGDNGFGMDAVTGTVGPQPGLPPGTLEVEVLDRAGAPRPNAEVKLGEVGEAKSVKLHQATTDAQGVARFTDLATGEKTAYAAVVVEDGMRVATQPFRMETGSGMRGQLRALERTSDPSVLRADNRSKIILDLREDAVAVMEALVLRNPSDKLYDSGNPGLMIPLPKGFIGAQEIQGGAPIETRPQIGVAAKVTVPPDKAAMYATQVRFGFVLGADGSTSLDYKQTFPFGVEAPLILVPESSRFTLRGPGVKLERDDKDGNGNTVHIYSAGDIAAGGTLALTIEGITQRDRSGAYLAGAFALALVLGGLALGRRPDGVRTAHKTRESLSETRERLFADLVALERERRSDGGEPGKKADLDERRRALVTKLEGIYRELATLEERGTAV